jgi:hypothetical protein
MGTYGSTWESRGYSGGGSVSELVNSLAGRPAVVCGSAESVFYELEDVLKKEPDAVIFGVNDIGMFLPRMDHWVSLHSQNLGVWKSVRWIHARPREDVKYHSIEERPFIDYNWQNLTPLFALSGYFAMQLAYIMGASPIILCGCPGSQAARFFEAAPRTDFAYGGLMAGSETGVREQLENEMKRLPDFKAAVRSMSGWTREFFGSL